MKEPKEMYVRTHFYKPSLGDKILGASVWGRVYAPFLVEDNVDCTVELITNNQPTVGFHLIDVTSIVSECDEYLSTDIITEMSNKDSALDLCNYIVENSTILDTLKAENIYVKPYSSTDYYYKFSFTPLLILI